VYDRPLAQAGLTWRQLIAWWAHAGQLAEDAEHDTARDLYRRLLACMQDNAAERLIFIRYCALYRTRGFDTPALIPQVYLHYDPYTRRASMPLTRQRMDFLLLLPHRRRVVIELDGIQHYAGAQQRADPRRYAQMVAEDRALQLAGYEVYRFGGHELADRQQAANLLDDFFTRLLEAAQSPE
jgi:very-short-patch-repair endonuclease